MQELSDAEWLRELRQRGIEVHACAGRLQVQAPRGAVDEAVRAELVRRKTGLLEILAREEGGRNATPTKAAALQPMDRRGRIPQTEAQQGMWLTELLSPGNVAYNIPEAFVVDAAVELEPLQYAVDRLLERHETLRTSFYEEDGEFLQRVARNVRAPVEFTDLSGMPEAERSRDLKEEMRRLGRIPFDLESAPLVRFHLFRMEAQRHVVFFNIHHIIADRRSLTVLREELSALYQAKVRNGEVRLPEMPVQYADYAIWVQQQAGSKEWQAQIAYWKQKLHGAPPFLDLTCRRKGVEMETAEGATAPVRLSPELRDGMRTLAREEGATLFMTLLTGFAALLYIRSGAEDFCVGSPFTHRKHVETEPLIGLFVNMLTFRCQVESGMSFRQLLQQVRGTALDAYDHSDVPFQELVRSMKLDPRTRRSPLFQVMFGFDSYGESEDAGIAQLDTQPGTARYELTLQLAEFAGKIEGALEYSTELFRPADMEAMGQELPRLMEWMLQHPDTSLAEYGERPENEAESATGAETAGWGGRLRKLFGSRG